MVAISRPFVGHYATYQGTVMASMARNMVREDFSELLLPKTDTLIGGERSLHLNQYPFPSVLAGLGFRFFGGSLEFWGRFQAIVFNAGSIILLGVLASLLFNPLTGWLSAVIFALSPYTLIYGQSFMSEACSLFFLLLSLCLITGRKGSPPSLFLILLSGISFSVAVTGRLHWILFLPLFGWTLIQDTHEHKLRNMIIFLIFSILMPITWYAHTYFAALNASNVHTNLFMQLAAEKPSGIHFLTDLQFYRKVFGIVSGTMLTPLLFPFLILGIVLADKKKASYWIVLSGVSVALVLLVLAPEKIMKHDFYLYGSFPFLVMFTAGGLIPVLNAVPVLRSVRFLGFALLLYLAVSARYFFNPIFKYPASEAKRVEVAEFVRRSTTPQDRIIAVGEGTGILIYYADRAAWPLVPSLIGKELAPYRKVRGLTGVDFSELERLEQVRKHAVSWFEYLRESGASFLVAADKGELNATPELVGHLESRYTNIAGEDADFYFYDIR